MKKRIFCVVAALAAGLVRAAGVYQWSVEVPEFVSKETGEHPRAYLWIPETCVRVRGVVVGNDNMLEETLFAHADFRRALAAADLAVVFVQSGFQGLNATCDAADAAAVFATLARLGAASGYTELGEVPIAPLGHSAWADWPYFMAFAAPERLFAAVSLKGSWPHLKPFRENFAARLGGVPTLLVSGEYENCAQHLKNGAAYYETQTNGSFKIVCDWGAGHFDYSPELPGLLGNFLAQSCGAAEGGENIFSFAAPLREAKTALMGFRTKDGAVIEQNPKYHLQVTIPWEPEADGTSFTLDPVYLDTVPPGRPEGWTGLKAGDAVTHPADARAIEVDIVQGGGVKTGPNRFALRFDRRGFKGYRARELVIKAVSPAQDGFRRSVQQAILRFPLKAREGSVDAPTGWYVREGAATVDAAGNVTWLPLPPRARRDHVATLCKYRRAANGETVYAFVKVARPVERRCDCYWHWMNGNVSTNGITADLNYLKAGGMDAAMIFDVGVGARRGPVDYGSAAWKACVAWASREAERLGLTLALHNSPGYSACGGPWIRPEESMKQLVWRVEVSSRVDLIDGEASTGGSGVPPLRQKGSFPCYEKRRDAASPSHDAGCSRDAKFNFYREIARYPLATADETIAVGTRLEKGESVELALDGEKDVVALNVWRGARETPLDPFDGPRDYGCTLKVEAQEGPAWRTVGEVRCPALRARDVPGFARLKTPVRTARLRLTSSRGANIDRAEILSSTPATGRTLVIGYTTTGQTVTAAPDAGIGLECDKFSRRGVDAHFDRHLAPLFAEIGRGAFTHLVIDSWEAGKQDWTDDFAEKFAARCGYDCRPWLPALTGRTVVKGRLVAAACTKEDEQGMVKFRFDYEETKKFLFETEFLAPFAERAHALGLLVAGEPYGDGDFDMETFTKYLDLPMSEYWAKSHYGTIERPLRVASAARKFGRTEIGCEAFTAFPGDADIAPTLENFADAIDLLKSAGVTRFVFHSVVHQPTDDLALTMGPFGTRFDRAHCTPSALRRITDYIKQR